MCQVCEVEWSIPPSGTLSKGALIVGMFLYLATKHAPRLIANDCNDLQFTNPFLKYRGETSVNDFKQRRTHR